MSEPLCHYIKKGLFTKHHWVLYEDSVHIASYNFWGKQTSFIQIGLSTCSSGFDRYSVPGIRLGQFLFTAICLMGGMLLFGGSIFFEDDGYVVTDNGFGIDDVIELFVCLFFGGLLLFIFTRLFVKHDYACCKKKNGEVSFHVIRGHENHDYEAFLGELNDVLVRMENN